MEQNRSTQADQRWSQTIPAKPRRTQNIAGNWQQSALSAKVRPPVQQPEIGAWLDSVRAQLDPAPPQKELEVERAMIAGIAAGLLLLVSGSIYWYSASDSKNDEPVVVVAGGSPSINAADRALVTGTPAPRKAAAPRSETPAWEARVPRVTEEAPTLLPTDNDSSPARRTAATSDARATPVALTSKDPERASSTAGKIVDTTSTIARAEEPKPAEPKAPRREPAPAVVRPQPAQPATTKLALVEPAAAPIQSGAVVPPTSAPEPVIEMPRLKFMRAPDYPVSAMRAGHNGTTTLELLVLENGVVGEATVLSSSGYPKLDAAAVAVAKRSWKFFPATKDGKPMAMKIEAPVRFSLDD